MAVGEKRRLSLGAHERAIGSAPQEWPPFTRDVQIALGLAFGLGVLLGVVDIATRGAL